MSDETPVPAEAADAQAPAAPAEVETAQAEEQVTEDSAETQDESLVERAEDAVKQFFTGSTPVLSRAPSSESPTQQPEAAPEAVKEPVSLEDAARSLLTFVKAHRTIGDADLAAAVADVEAALPADPVEA